MLRNAASAAGFDLIVSRPALPYDVFFNLVPETHVQFFEGLALYHRSSDCLCVHGGLNPRVPRVQDQPREALIWGAEGFPEHYDGSEIVVYGHWNNADIDSGGWPKPKIIGKTIGLDTISHGVLSAMRLPDQRLFQSARYETCRFDAPAPSPEPPAPVPPAPSP